MYLVLKQTSTCDELVYTAALFDLSNVAAYPEVVKEIGFSEEQFQFAISNQKILTACQKYGITYLSAIVSSKKMYKDSKRRFPTEDQARIYLKAYKHYLNEQYREKIKRQK